MKVGLAHLKEDPMSFVQIIEFQTSRIGEFDAALDDWIAKSEGWRAPTRAVHTEDRDRPGTYLQIVEFPSYEKAMENSARPETAEFAQRLVALCDGPPTFRNLDVLREVAM
jgi:hypothetical protein